MRSPAAAIAWEFRQRHRWGLIALAGYLLFLATIKLVIPGPSLTFNMDSGERFGLVVMGPLTATFLYVLTVFSFGLSGDVAGRPSMYPARMFTLPVSTTALTFWPMLYGSVTMVLLWLATRFLAVWPTGITVPTIWPALLAVSLLTWTQALTWMPYGLPGLRVVAAVLWLSVSDSIVLLALQYRATEPVMLAIVAPQIPLAYVAARVAVARARRGDVPDWRGLYTRPARTAVAPPDQRKNFASPARAQAWFEWQGHGRSLPASVAILLPFELALLFIGGNKYPSLVEFTLFLVLITPPFMAAFAAATVRRSNPDARDAYGCSPFIATRPASTATLVAAKLKASIRSTLAAWLLVILAIPLALELSGKSAMVMEGVRRVIETVGTPRAIVFALLGMAGLLASTWKQLVQSLYVGLSGREWIVKAGALLTLLFLAAIGPFAIWVVENSNVRLALWNSFPWILVVLVCCKMSAAVWIATRLYRSRILSDRTLLSGAACWVVAVLALYGVLAWLLFVPSMPRYLLGLVAILAIPLARLSAAPLALAWNRHR
jgi:hypothetical protein